MANVNKIVKYGLADFVKSLKNEGLSDGEIARTIAEKYGNQYPELKNISRMSVARFFEALAREEAKQQLQSGKSEDEKIRDFIVLVLLSFFVIIIPVIGPLLFLILLIVAISQLMSREWYYISELTIEGDRNTVVSLVREIRSKVYRRLIHMNVKVARAIRRKLGVNPYELERQWYSI